MVVNSLVNKFSNDQTVGLAWIYCNYGRKHEQNLSELVGSLLKQLAERLPSLPDGVKKLYEQHETDRTRPATQDIVATLRTVVQSYSRVFIIIDALDECQVSEGCRDRLISELFGLQETLPVNILAISRDDPSITSRFKEKIPKILEISAEHDDVVKYLESQMRIMPASFCNALYGSRLDSRDAGDTVKVDTSELEGKSGLRSEIVETVAEATKGMYVYDKPKILPICSTADCL